MTSDRWHCGHRRHREARRGHDAAAVQTTYGTNEAEYR
jgi:hypothetical protein